jgi:hypothetical protein
MKLNSRLMRLRWNLPPRLPVDEGCQPCRACSFFKPDQLTIEDRTSKGNRFDLDQREHPLSAIGLIGRRLYGGAPVVLFVRPGHFPCATWRPVILAFLKVAMEEGMA